MKQAYPVTLIKDNDSFIVKFPDVPEALTIGHDPESALQWAEDALIVALSSYMDAKLAIPKPTKPKPSQPVIVLPPLIATKLAIYQAMREQQVTQTELALRLHCDARQVRRLLDLDHHSRMDLIDDALHELGKKLAIDILPLFPIRSNQFSPLKRPRAHG